MLVTTSPSLERLRLSRTRSGLSLGSSDGLNGCNQIDARGNAILPHYNREGVCGFEIKNKGFTGFAPGGDKSLFSVRDSTLRPNENARYISTAGGALNAIQPALIRSAHRSSLQ